MKTAVLALGGNALIQPGENAELKVELKHLNRTLKSVLSLFKKYKVIITHGNGPQVGNLILQQKNSEKIGVSKVPLYVNVARTQGEIGILIQEMLQELLAKEKIKLPIVNILTRIIVDSKDPNFKNPSKPVGPFYTKKVKELGKTFIKTEKGYRKIVPSPNPLEIVELNQIKTLSKKNIIICCGGGGIPVNSELKGVNAVIDKDLTSQKLATSVKADLFVILTNVENVYLNFNAKNQEKLSKISINKLKKYYEEGQFMKGSMRPKILSAINFIKEGGNKVIIASPKNVQKALEGTSGTIITK